MRRTLLASLLSTVSVSAMAQSAAPSVQSVPVVSHIRQVHYSPTVRIDVVGVVGEPVTFVMPKGEDIYRVIGTAKVGADGKFMDAGWRSPTDAEVKDAPLGNAMPLWPVEPGQSLMTVITKSADGTQKPYVFRLITRAAVPGAEDAPDVVQTLVFTDAPPPNPQAVAAWVAKKHADDAARAVEKIKADTLVALQEGCQFYAKGKKINTITPRCPTTNGIFTWFRFPGLSRKPAIYVMSEADGGQHERLARQHEEGDKIAVEEIAQRFRLRLGDEVVDIINADFDPVGADPETGTISHGVIRQIITAKP